MTTVSKINKCFAFIILFLMIFSTQKGIAQTNSFYVYFEQNGKRINIQKEKVELKKQAFTMHVEYTEAVDLFVNVSTNPKTYLKTKKGRLMYSLPAFSNLDNLESMFSKKNVLYLSKTKTQIWKKEETDAKKLTTTKRKNVVVNKTVDKLFSTKRNKTILPRDYSKDIYLVFIYAEKDKSGDYHEVQRELVKINWVKTYEEDTKTYARKKKIEGKQKIRQAKRNLKRKQKLAKKEKKRLEKKKKKAEKENSKIKKQLK